MLVCGICQAQQCKNCAHFLDDDDFSFIPVEQQPEHLRHDAYCRACFIEKIEPELEIYNETKERAKDVAVYLKDQGKESRLIKRAEFPVVVAECKDHDETQWRLAYLATVQGYNTLVKVEITAKKIRHEAYQTSIWSGTGWPAQVDRKKDPNYRPRRSPSR
jgi:hypothetical protein